MVVYVFQIWEKIYGTNNFKSENFVFLGYSMNDKGYLFLNPMNGKITFSWDVIFHEDDLFCYKEHYLKFQYKRNSKDQIGPKR